jgi:hypothetical protein
MRTACGSIVVTFVACSPLPAVLSLEDRRALAKASKLRDAPYLNGPAEPWLQRRIVCVTIFHPVRRNCCGPDCKRASESSR